MFIIRVLKLLSMHGKFIVLAFILIFMCAAPVAGSTAKIAAGAPVFIGETNLDISKSLNGCHSIAWWQNGTNTSAPPEKNITLYEINTFSDIIYHYNISPNVFTGHTGTWYCTDKKPFKPILEVLEPQLDIMVWDLDHNQDVSGKSVPVSTNITYRVDTNLYHALKSLNRPDINPLDSFFTVTLTDSYGQNTSNIFTGSAGNPKTQILPFDKQPFITESPFYWKNGKDWDRSARNANGEPIYPSLTYTFTISQNLNHMAETYHANGITDIVGKITRAKTITFVKDTTSPASPASPVTTVTAQPVMTTEPGITLTSSGTDGVPHVTTVSPVAKKTTYSPLAEWITLLGVVMAGLVIIRKRT
jgi:hypothetical protein